MIHWLRTWGALLIAGVALAQPWAIAILRRYLRPGRIDIYETGLIEIGYGGLGSSVGLLGTLRAIDRDLFVESMTLRVTRVRDQSQHDFEWAAFRPFSMAPMLELSSLEMPVGFMLLTSTPQRYNVFFRDNATQEAQRDAAAPLQAEWKERVDKAFLDALVAAPHGTSQEDLAEMMRQSEQQLFVAILNDSIYQQAAVDLDRICYWDAGTYRLALEVKTPDQTFSKYWTFSLTDADERGLRANVPVALAIALGREAPRQLYGATVKFEPDAAPEPGRASNS
jgi:hypothetical protein